MCESESQGAQTDGIELPEAGQRGPTALVRELERKGLSASTIANYLFMGSAPNLMGSGPYWSVVVQPSSLFP
jgi:hypothetical protein